MILKSQHLKQFAGVMIADTAIDFMIQSLRKYDNILSNRFQTALLFEIEQRRTELCDIILCLHMGLLLRFLDPDRDIGHPNAYWQPTENFNNAVHRNKATFCKKIITILQRLDSNICTVTETEQEDAELDEDEKYI